MKTCRRCSKQLPLSNFGRLSIASDGLNYNCKPCNSRRGLERYYVKRKEILYKTRQRRVENHEAVLQIERNSRAKNKEKNRPAKNARQSIRNRLVQGKRFTILEKELRKIYASPCFSCGSMENQSLDHIIPLSKGGNHSVGNLQTLCISCNTSKHDKIFTEWKYSTGQKERG